MKVIYGFLCVSMLFASGTSQAGCDIKFEIDDLVIGGVVPRKFLKSQLQKKGYQVVSTLAEADYDLRMGRFTAMYEEGQEPADHESQIDGIDGSLKNIRTGEIIQINELREVRYLGSKRSSSFKTNVKNALAKLPDCKA